MVPDFSSDLLVLSTGTQESRAQRHSAAFYNTIIREIGAERNSKVCTTGRNSIGVVPTGLGVMVVP